MKPVSLFLFPLLAIAAGSVSPAESQEAPEIHWELTNRFGPFQATSIPEDLFAEWSLGVTEDLEQWHKRLSETLVDFTSPYASALQETGESAHWSSSEQLHTAKVRALLHDQNALVPARVWSDRSGPCAWTLPGEVEVRKIAECQNRISFDLPLSGADLTLSIGEETWTRRLAPDHKVVVAFGDSYASGEGNPDVPAQWKSWSGTRMPRVGSVGWLAEPNRRSRQALWVDPACRRSFFAHQSLTALKLASEDPHRFISFLHYGCSGAEVFDGLLTPQRRFLKEKQDELVESDRAYRQRSQLDAAITDLCASVPGRSDYSAKIRREVRNSNIPRFQRDFGFTGMQNDAVQKAYYDPARARSAGAAGPRSGIATCPEDSFQQPDLILLSILGNDAGFSSIVHYFAVPVDFQLPISGISYGSIAMLGLAPEFCPQLGNRYGNGGSDALRRFCERATNADPGYDAGHLIFGRKVEPVAGSDYGCEPGNCVGRSIVDRFGVAIDAISTYLKVAPDDIVVPAYPDPLRSSAEVGSDTCEKLPNYAVTGLDIGQEVGEHDVLGPWNALPAILYDYTRLRKNRVWADWEYNITKSEAALALRQIDELRAAMVRASKLTGVTFVCETRDAFIGHDWLQGRRLYLPNATTDEAWDPAELQAYDYDPADRAIRLPNDSFLIQGDDDRFADFQGTAHPNLTGHRLIANIVAPVAEGLLGGLN